MKKKPRVLIVGVVRDCQNTFEKEFDRLVRSCDSVEIIGSYFVESDSNDRTVEVLESLKHKYENFHFESLGSLSSNIPHRIHRIRYCRNKYVAFLRTNHSISDLDFIIVADMDGINSALKKFSINSCFKTDYWDALFSNQLFGISDLLALRAPSWVEDDYLVELENSRLSLRAMPTPRTYYSKLTRYLQYDKTRVDIIYSRMRYIGCSKDLISVDSAFGGIGIYRSWCFFDSDYSEDESPGVCEHVSFHKKLKSKGAKMYINPRFINSILNTYNINKFFIIRNLRLWRWNRKES